MLLAADFFTGCAAILTALAGLVTAYAGLAAVRSRQRKQDRDECEVELQELREEYEEVIKAAIKEAGHA